MHDVFSDQIREHLEQGHQPARLPRDWGKIRHRAFMGLMASAIILYVIGGLMTTAAAMWHVMGH
jgi:hypothetical protein